MRLGNPTRLEERSSGIKLFTVCMYGHGLAATALLQKCSTRQRAPAVGMLGFGAVHGEQSSPRPKRQGFSDSDPADRRQSGRVAAQRCGAQQSSQAWHGRRSSRVASGRLRVCQ